MNDVRRAVKVIDIGAGHDQFTSEVIRFSREIVEWYDRMDVSTDHSDEWPDGAGLPPASATPSAADQLQELYEILGRHGLVVA